MKQTIWAFLVIVLGLGLAACTGGTRGEQKRPEEQAVAQKPAARKAIEDYSLPYLTDEKMVKFIASMKEERNPFELMFREGGQVRGLGEMTGKLEELNASARRYGFKDYEDYLSVWGRIVVGELQLAGVEMMEETIKSTEDELKKPDLDPDTRKAYEEQIEASRKSLAEMKTELNEADLALVKKYRAQIDEAAKKYRKG